MGVDVYMRWKDVTEEERRSQITGFRSSGNVGYLRGTYFGGLSDALKVLFGWMSWDEETPFDPVAFEVALTLLKSRNGERPEKGRWDYTEGSELDLSERQNAPIDAKDFQEYQDFLELGKRLLSEGKEPYIYISY